MTPRQIKLLETERDRCAVTANFCEMPGHAAILREMVEALNAAIKDHRRLEYIQNEYLCVEPFNIPTGQGDADVGWEVSQWHEGKPTPISLVTHYRDDVRAAIDETMNK
jgi:hypothetical protein